MCCYYGSIITFFFHSDDDHNLNSDCELLYNPFCYLSKVLQYQMQRPAPPPTSQVQRFSMSGGSTSIAGTSPAATYTSIDKSRSLSCSNSSPLIMSAARPSTSGGLATDITSPPVGIRQRASSSGGLKSDTDSFVSMLPSKIQASLKTFEELQLQKSALLTTAASTPPTGTNTPPTLSGWSASGKLSQSSNSFSAREAARKEREFQRKLQVSEAVMKKLHRKNQKLVKENERLRCTVPTGGDVTTSSNENNSEAAAKIHKLENRIRQLTETTSTPVSNTTDSHRALQQKFESLQHQYDSLLQSRVDSISNTSSTAKINREVKTFFVALRKKIHSDLFEHEVERIVWNEKMADLEEQTCAKYVDRMLEEAA